MSEYWMNCVNQGQWKQRACFYFYFRKLKQYIGKHSASCSLTHIIAAQDSFRRARLSILVRAASCQCLYYLSFFHSEVARSSRNWTTHGRVRERERVEKERWKDRKKSQTRKEKLYEKRHERGESSLSFSVVQHVKYVETMKWQEQKATRF